MAIDIEAEDLVPFQFAGDAFPRGVRKPSKATLHRWRKPPGSRGVVLETILIGSVRYTSTQAILRFCNGETAQAKTVEAPSTRRRKSSAALKALSGMGIG